MCGKERIARSTSIEDKTADDVSGEGGAHDEVVEQGALDKGYTGTSGRDSSFGKETSCSGSNGDEAPNLPAINMARVPPREWKGGLDFTVVGKTLVITFEKLVEYACKYPWPEGVELCLPREGSNCLERFPRSMVVFMDNLRVGFHLPMMQH